MTAKSFSRAGQILSMSFFISASVFAGPAEDAQAVFAKFFPAFVARNQNEISAMFAPDAQFYGTLSQDLVTTPEGVSKYFTAGLDRPDIIEAKPVQFVATALTDNIVLIAGTWRLDRTIDGKITTGNPLRMSAVLQKRSDRWMVVQFHNSLRPLPPSPQPAASR